LTFNDNVEFFRANEIATITIGEFVHKNKQNPNGEYPVFNGGISETGFYDEFNNEGNKIIISARGANAGFVNKIFKPYWAGNSCYTIDIINKEKINWLFIFYYLKNNQSILIGDQQKGGIPAVSKKQIENFKIPIPPLSEQNRIVSILDKFDALVSDISIGLPAELKARRQQYEYYRGKLLTFKEKQYAK
jgi:type I restriction enzyme S subunit